jgi:hypothetical protein
MIEALLPFRLSMPPIDPVGTVFAAVMMAPMVILVVWVWVQSRKYRGRAWPKEENDTAPPAGIEKRKPS